MNKNIVVTSALQEKFKAAWAQRQIILFSAPCGFGKSAAASALLKGKTVCYWDAMEGSLPLETADFSCNAVLLDNLQMLKSPAAQQALCAAIREHPEVHFILLSRGKSPKLADALPV